MVIYMVTCGEKKGDIYDDMCGETYSEIMVICVEKSMVKVLELERVHSMSDVIMQQTCLQEVSVTLLQTVECHTYDAVNVQIRFVCCV